MPEIHRPEADREPVRIAVVGTGNVGSTFAYALLSGLAAEIVLIDVNRAKAEGEAMDLNHTVPFRPEQAHMCDYPDCASAAVTVIAAGIVQKAGETRLDLLKRNAAVFAEIVPQVVKAQHRRRPADRHQSGGHPDLRHLPYRASSRAGHLIGNYIGYSYIPQFIESKL
jgi:lactate/malate dehydrogenase family protein